MRKLAKERNIKFRVMSEDGGSKQIPQATFRKMLATGKYTRHIAGQERVLKPKGMSELPKGASLDYKQIQNRRQAEERFGVIRGNSRRGR